MRFWTQCQSDSFWSCSLCFYCNMSLCDGLQLPKLVEVRVSPLEVVVCTFGFNLKNYGHSCPQDVFWVSKKKKHNFIVFFRKEGTLVLRHTWDTSLIDSNGFNGFCPMVQYLPAWNYALPFGRQHLRVGDPPKQILSKLSFPAFCFSIHSLFELHMHFWITLKPVICRVLYVKLFLLFWVWGGAKPTKGFVLHVRWAAEVELPIYIYTYHVYISTQIELTWLYLYICLHSALYLQHFTH